MSRSFEPRNPYASYLIDASAGCGKTYQLTQRFLYLVGAGAAPDSILTITFTKKAAAEMRERILYSAQELSRSPELQQTFAENIRHFHAQANSPHPIAPPLSGAATASSILAATQRLRVTTIDSVFYEWVRRFPVEAGEAGEPFPAAFDLTDEAQSQEMADAAWADLLRQDFAEWYDRNQLIAEQLLQGGGVLGLKKLLDTRQRHDTYTWWARRQLGDGSSHLNFPVVATSLDQAAFWHNIIPHLRTLANTVNPVLSESIHAAMATHDLAALLATGLFTKDTLRISQKYLRGKKLVQYAAEIEHLNQAVPDLVNGQRLQFLNAAGTALDELHGLWQQRCDLLKRQRKMATFADLTKGAYTLFHDDRGWGARYLLQRSVQHLLIDEFQDTSQLQWSIFADVARELLSGEGLTTEGQSIAPTVFLVGDVKQSIYGFREADPTVMHAARQELQPFGLRHVILSESFRSSAVILDFANTVFATTIPEFPIHATAQTAGQSVMPRHGSIQVFPCLPRPAAGAAHSAAELEAELIAERLATALADPWLHPVFDRKQKQWRPLSPIDCAILYRNGTHAKTYLAALHRRGIAALREDSGGLLHHSLAKDVIALWRFFAIPEDGAALMRVLRSPFFRCSDADLSTLAERQLQAPKAPLADLVAAHLPAEWQLLATSRHGAWTERPSALLWQFTQKTALWANLRRELTDVECAQCQGIITRMLELLVSLEQRGQSLPHAAYQTLKQAQDSDQYAAPAVAADAVRLMTIHKAKGLEFPLVVLADAASPWQKPERHWLRPPAATGEIGLMFIGGRGHRPMENTVFDRALAIIADEQRQESMRVLYVALTRSMHYLLVTAHAPFQRARGAEDHHALLLEAVQRLGAKPAAADDALSPWEFAVEAPESRPPLKQAHQPKGSAQKPLEHRPKQTLTATPLPWPHELQIKSPHAASAGNSVDLQLRRTPSSRYPAALASGIGTFIHAGLEARLRTSAWDELQQWDLLFSKANLDLESATTIDRHDLPVLYEQARTELEQAWNHECFQEMLRQATHRRAEVPFVWRDGNCLWRGAMDLVLWQDISKEVVLLDYKTGISHEAASLLAYGPQINVYAHALAAMHPGWRVRAFLYLTAVPRLHEVTLGNA